MHRINQIIVLSIVALQIAVNASGQDLTSFNKAARSKSPKTLEFDHLVNFLKKNGQIADLIPSFGPIIGLPEAPMSLRGNETSTHGHGNDRDSRECSIVYKKFDTASPADPNGQAICLYIKRRSIHGHDSHALWYRVSLEGKLEKAIVIDGKYDDAGKPIQGSGTPFDQDINSTAVQKSFKAELSYWTKDWLKKQKK